MSRRLRDQRDVCHKVIDIVWRAEKSMKFHIPVYQNYNCGMSNTVVAVFFKRFFEKNSERRRQFAELSQRAGHARHAAAEVSDVFGHHLRCIPFRVDTY